MVNPKSRVDDVRLELEGTKLKFGDSEQIERLNVLRMAEELIGKDHWDNTCQEWVVYDRRAVYRMRVSVLMETLEYLY